MKFILLLGPLLLLSSAQGYAEWMVAGKNDDMTQYIDPETIRQNEELVRFWALLDFKTAQSGYGGKRYSSVRTQTEIDCSEMNIRGLAMTVFSGNLEEGKVQYNDSFKEEWHPIPPRSLSDSLRKLVCKKK